MVIFGKPKNPSFYICVDSDGCIKLHELGFSPVYRFEGFIYFTKTKEILKMIEELKIKLF